MDGRIGQEARLAENDTAHLVAALLANLERDGQQTDSTKSSQEPPLGDILRTLVQHVEKVMP